MCLRQLPLQTLDNLLQCCELRGDIGRRCVRSSGAQPRDLDRRDSDDRHYWYEWGKVHGFAISSAAGAHERTSTSAAWHRYRGWWVRPTIPATACRQARRGRLPEWYRAPRSRLQHSGGIRYE